MQTWVWFPPVVSPSKNLAISRVFCFHFSTKFKQIRKNDQNNDVRVGNVKKKQLNRTICECFLVETGSNQNSDRALKVLRARECELDNVTANKFTYYIIKKLKENKNKNKIRRS